MDYRQNSIIFFTYGRHRDGGGEGGGGERGVQSSSRPIFKFSTKSTTGE